MAMKTKRKYFYLDDFEHRLLVGCLITARNEYIHEDKPSFIKYSAKMSHRSVDSSASARPFSVSRIPFSFSEEISPSEHNFFIAFVTLGFE